MKSALGPLRLLQPRSLDEALHMLRDEGNAAAPVVPLAGGTDVYVGLNFGAPAGGPGGAYVDVWGLRGRGGLSGVRRVGTQLHIGALTTFAALAEDALIARYLPILAAAARTIGGVQIQNRATVGGNLANASPAADSVPVLAVADAQVVLRSVRGERVIGLDDFFVAYRRTARAPDELLVGVRVSPLAGPTRPFFRKVGTRAANAISKVVMAASRGPARGGPRIALGSVGPMVVRARRTEAALAAGAGIEAAVETLMSEITPIDDLRSTEAYRRRVAGNLLRQFWAETG